MHGSVFGHGHTNAGPAAGQARNGDELCRAVCAAGSCSGFCMPVLGRRGVAVRGEFQHQDGGDGDEICLTFALYFFNSSLA